MLIIIAGLGVVVLAHQIMLQLLMSRLKRCEDTLANTRAVLESSRGAALRQRPALLLRDKPGAET